MSVSDPTVSHCTPRSPETLRSPRRDDESLIDPLTSLGNQQKGNAIHVASLAARTDCSGKIVTVTRVSNPFLYTTVGLECSFRQFSD